MFLETDAESLAIVGKLGLAAFALVSDLRTSNSMASSRSNT